MHLPPLRRSDQFIVCASRSPAEAGSQFFGHAEYGVLTASNSVEFRTPRHRESVWYGSYMEDVPHAEERGCLQFVKVARAVSTSQGPWPSERSFAVKGNSSGLYVQGTARCTVVRACREQPTRACSSVFFSSSSLPRQSVRAIIVPSARPNTSLKLSANGMARWPCGAGASPHFAPPAQRAMPLAPA